MARSNYSNSTSDMIEKAALQYGIPSELLRAMAMVESGCSPYSVNTAGGARRFNSETEAVNFIKDEVRRGNRNMSVGCMQLHYQTHGRYFTSVADMVSCEKNILYAASLLRSLYDRYGSWEKAVKMYHSRRAKYSSRYYKKVMKQYGGDKKLLAD
ncbi:MAG: lytic transglycosylase domain-containing protein [Holosporales bacterium]|jgi:soluble lytic murein transglycosylase-like protein|nr:lytic transglycosylase domain-containing protein [Holosporales bacterium]